VSGGLTRRTIVSSALLALVVGATFALLVRAVGDARAATDQATRSLEAIAAGTDLERVVLDLETGQSGYLIERDERFLEPWRRAMVQYPRASRALLDAAEGDARSRAITRAVDGYVHGYSIPLVVAARRGEGSARRAARLDEGRRRVDDIRREFDGFLAAQRTAFRQRQDRADDDSRRALAIATAGLAGSMLLVLGFGTYVTRTIALPVRRAAGMAKRLAAGDLSTRLPETGAGEVATLERAFNSMAGSLETSRDGLRALADEQAALRRVATLVARAVPAPEVFDAVAGEVRRLLDADATRLVRFDPDGGVTTVGRRGGDAAAEGDGRLDGDARAGGPAAAIVAAVRRDGRPARTGAAVATPIVVEDHLWGVMVATWSAAVPAVDSEERMGQFTDLVATAVANAESRAALAASRARVVATADETRRRIERDLHDGAQQRLVHTLITLKLALRELGDGEPGQELVAEALEQAERATAELRDLAHGILPAALSHGGLRAGVETLVPRLRIPVTVDVTDERFPPALEATAYFVVAEALTNTLKHAHAQRARVSAARENGALRVEVRDDGVGGAHGDERSGLLGLEDRAAAVNGELVVESPPGGGTVIRATLPIPRG